MKFMFMILVILNLAMQMLAEDNAEEAEKEDTEEIEEEEGEEEGEGEGKEYEEEKESVSKSANSEVIKNCNKQAEANFEKCVVWNHSVTLCEKEKAHFLHRCLPRQHKGKKAVNSREYAEIAKNCYKQADNNFNQCVIWNLGTKMCTLQRNTYLFTCLPRKKLRPHEDTRALRSNHHNPIPKQENYTNNKSLKFQKNPTVDQTTIAPIHRVHFVNSEASQKESNVVDVNIVNVVTNNTGSKDPDPGKPPVAINMDLHIPRPGEVKDSEAKVEETGAKVEEITSKPDVQNNSKEHDVNIVNVVTNNTGSKDPDPGKPPVAINMDLHIPRPVEMKDSEAKVEETGAKVEESTSKPDVQNNSKEHDKFSFLDKMETSEELEW